MEQKCPHLISGISVPGVRKRMKTKGMNIACNPCSYKAFSDVNEFWICLQCGNIGCGDSRAQDGDAKKHYETPRSDDHSVVLHLEKDSRCWCYKCNIEIDSRNGHLNDIKTLVKRNFKQRTTQQHAQIEHHIKANWCSGSGAEDDEKPKVGPPTVNSTSTIAIPLPPPSPQTLFPGIDGPKKKKKSFLDRNRSQGGYGKNRPLGLTNIGNTCFMNSALQCLASTRLLLPKLEIFGAGNPIRVLVTQVQDEASVVVLGQSTGDQDASAAGAVTNGNNSDDPGAACGSSAESGIGSLYPEPEEDEESMKPLVLNLEISPESMTGRLREAFSVIRKSSAPGAEIIQSCSYGWHSFTPSEIQSLLVKQFRRGQQHDSHELLRTILDMMKKDQTKAFRLALMKHYGIPIKNGAASLADDSDPNLVELVKSLDQKVKHKTFVDEIFGGELVTTQTCLTCQHVKRSHEQFLDLSLPIRVIKHNEDEKPTPSTSFKKFSLFDTQHNIVINKTLNDCLKSFTEPELLTGSNEVECENCHKIKLAQLECLTGDEIVDDEYVVISSVSASASASASASDGEQIPELGDPPRIAPIPCLGPEEEDSTPAPLSGLSVLQLEPPEENFGDGLDDDTACPNSGTASDTDFDLGPAVGDRNEDGPSSSPSPPDSNSSVNGEGGDQSARNRPSFLNLPTYDKFENYHLQSVSGDSGDGLEHYKISSEADGDSNPVDLTLGTEKSKETTAAGTTATASASADDEGFSEGENSTAVENEKKGSGGSSSRNSISEDPDEKTEDSKLKTSSKKCTKKPTKPKVTKCPCSRQQNISRPPQCLTIHLKRFQMTLGGLPQKLNDNVSFPLLLDISQFCSEDCEDKDENGEVAYSLYGIVEHSGSINWGHYVAYVKCPSPEGEGPEWYYISDSCVDSSTESRVTDQEAYILFYERVRGDEKIRRKNSIVASAPVPLLSDDCWKNWDTGNHIHATSSTSGAAGDSWDYPTISIEDETSPTPTPATPIILQDKEAESESDSDIPALEPLTGPCTTSTTSTSIGSDYNWFSNCNENYRKSKPEPFFSTTDDTFGIESTRIQRIPRVSLSQNKNVHDEDEKMDIEQIDKLLEEGDTEAEADVTLTTDSNGIAVVGEVKEEADVWFPVTDSF